MSLVFEQEPDRVPRRVLVQATVVVVVAIVASILAALWLARGQLGEELAPRSEVPQPLDATLFDLVTPAELARRSAEVHLASYGWVDKKRGIIHVPIAIAIERYLAEAR